MGRNLGNTRLCVLAGLYDDEGNSMLADGVCEKGECRRCGWNNSECKRRQWKLQHEGMTDLAGGLRGLVIPKKPELLSISQL